MQNRTAGSTALLLAALVGALLTGCGNVNKGSQAVEDFESWWADHPLEGVEVLRTTAHNTLPYVGAGEIRLHPGTSVAVPDLVDHVCSYDADANTVFHLDSEADTGPTVMSRDVGVEMEVDCTAPGATAQRWEALIALPDAEFVRWTGYELAVR